jgi:hypothetical protein
MRKIAKLSEMASPILRTSRIWRRTKKWKKKWLEFDWKSVDFPSHQLWTNSILSSKLIWFEQWNVTHAHGRTLPLTFLGYTDFFHESQTKHSDPMKHTLENEDN